MPRKPNTSLQTRAVMAALSAAPDGWRYGYELCKLTGVKSGTLYPLLMRLHDQGYLQSQWRPAEASGRPPRNAYRLTSEGELLASTLAADYAAPAPKSVAEGQPA